MRSELRDPARLEHIIKAIDNINDFMEGHTIEDLKNESLLYFGVVKNMEIIGEAAYKLTLQFKDRHPDTPWKIIIGMRHVLVHGYYQISPTDIWDVYVNELAILKKQISDYISESK